MSSNIRVQKICEYCKNEFTARKTVSRTCSDNCAKRLYKQKQRAEKIAATDKATLSIKMQPLEEIKAKEFLTVRDLSKLLSCSIRTAYRIIDKGNIKAVNLSQRKTIIKRSEIDKLFA